MQFSTILSSLVVEDGSIFMNFLTNAASIQSVPSTSALMNGQDATGANSFYQIIPAFCFFYLQR
uniref:Uncharacterized protein n=2 Tax=Vitis vinifera TaxID=29760 RepID=A5B6R2_VITVI|nr:hypothetical protein VITISV_018634 [Vitis vinifera]